MTNGNDILEFQEENIERLTEQFIKEHINDWEIFVMNEFNSRGEE